MLSLAFDGFGNKLCANFTTNGCGTIGKALFECSNIENLRLMYINPMNSEDTITTFKAVQNMKGIKSLVLKLKASEPVNAEVFVALKETLIAISSVEKFYLILEDFREVTDQDMKELLRGISHLHNMENFCFGMMNAPRITDESLHSAVATLKNLKSLKAAHLCFSLGIFGQLMIPKVKFQNMEIQFCTESAMSSYLSRLTSKLDHN